MYKKYIKIEGYNVTDVFFEYQEEKFDGNEIFLEEVEERRHNIKGKSISNDYGASIFEYKNKKVSRRKQSDIDKDEKTIAYNLKKVEEEKEVLINEKIKQIAIEALEAEGKL